MTLNGVTRHVNGYLRDFLFPPGRARSPVKALSGGERNRLLLARLFTRPANVLVLDEPTNDLDLETLELLESQLVEWPGTLLLVSHDRAFLDNVVTSTFVFEGDGRVQEYVGGYEDWVRQQDATAAGLKASSTIRAMPDTAGLPPSPGYGGPPTRLRQGYGGPPTRLRQGYGGPPKRREGGSFERRRKTRATSDLVDGAAVPLGARLAHALVVQPLGRGAALAVTAHLEPGLTRLASAFD